MFPISMITGDPLWNSLPAAKIINYPLEKADYKPYAQARLCVSNDDFYYIGKDFCAKGVFNMPQNIEEKRIE